MVLVVDVLVVVEVLVVVGARQQALQSPCAQQAVEDSKGQFSSCTRPWIHAEVQALQHEFEAKRQKGNSHMRSGNGKNEHDLVQSLQGFSGRSINSIVHYHKVSESEEVTPYLLGSAIQK